MSPSTPPESVPAFDDLAQGRVPRAVLVSTPKAGAFGRAAPLAPGRIMAAAVAGPIGHAAARLLVELGAVVCADGEGLPENLGGLVDLRMLDVPVDVGGALSHAKASLFLAQRAQRALRAAAAAGGGFYLVVTRLGRSRLSPVSAAVHGLLKTAALEWPEVACSVVDIAPALDAAAVVREELGAGFLDLEVERTVAGRFVPGVVERAVADAGTSLVDASSVIVASGGARGVTATTLLALARAAHPAFLLLGRTAIVDEPACCRGVLDEPGLKRALLDDAKAAGKPVSLPAVGEAARSVLAVREILSFIATLEAAGARVLYRDVDVRSTADVARACAEARSVLGPITGIVHGAGVLADKRIEDKTAEQVARVMDTKVLGLDAMLQATAADPLKIVALFSSVAGRFGNVGQVDYAMANEALNEMAHAIAADARHIVVKSFNWGPWEGGMVTPALKKLFEERGVRVLSHTDGARHFVDELRSADGAIEVIFGGALVPEAPPGRHVDAEIFPALADHAIHGAVVLPVAAATALMARAAGAEALTDIRVLRGVPLPRFFDAGHDVVLKLDGDRSTLWLPGEAAPRYAARVASASGPGPTHALPAPGPLSPFPFDRTRIYETLLFHGGRFQLIDSVDGIGERGLAATVRGARGAGWSTDLPFDVGAVDVALQAVLLWARHRTGGAFLPTSIARLEAKPDGAVGPLSCMVSGISCDDARATADVQITDAAGAILVDLRGVEVHRLADDDAFARGPEDVREGAR